MSACPKPTAELYVTTDNGGTFNKATPSGTWGFSGGEVEIHPIVRASDGTYLLTSSQGIAKSSDAQSWSLIPNSGGRVVGLTKGDGKIYSSDQWSSAYHVANDTDPTRWTVVSPPPSPGDQGAPYIDYDTAHHVLYSSNFASGVWRLVTE